MSRWVIILCVCLCWPGLSAAVLAPDWSRVPVTKDYVSRTWEADEGLPGNRVLGIAQGADGYLWVATAGGLVRFDGVRFVPFWTEVPFRESGDLVHSISVARNGALWIGSQRGEIRRWSNGVVDAPLTPIDLPAAPVTSFAEDRDGRIWFS